VDLKASAASGVKWSLVGTLASQVARLVTAFVLARVLGPERYGVVAIAYVYLALATVLIDQAFGLLVVQRPTLSREELGSATLVNASGVVLLAAMTIVVAPHVATFFDEPRVGPVIRVLALDLVFRGLAAIPLGLLARRLRFRAIASIQLLATLAASISAVAAGLGGAGHWALVVQALVQDGLILAGAFLLAGLPVFAFSRNGLRGIVAFSGALMVAHLLDFAGLNVDSMLIGRQLGAEQLAFYGLAYRLMLLFLDVITGVIYRVALPTLARAQDDLDRMRRGFLLAVRAATIGSFAVLSTAALLFPSLLPVLLGEKWRPAIVPLVLLLAAAGFRVLLYMWGPLATALGRTDLVLVWTFIVVGTTVSGFFVGIHWGIGGIAASYLITSSLLVLPNAAHVGRQTGLRLSEFVSAVLPAITAMTVQVVAWVLVAFGGEWLGLPEIGAALVATAVGMAAYVGVVRIGWPQVFDETGAMVRMVLGRPGTGGPGESVSIGSA
jgi:PST family polysaccharide transporter